MKPRLLVLDDEQRMVDILAMVLRREGYEVHPCVRPREALDALRAAPFDLLITDLKMPDMDGLTILQQAKAIDAELTIILLTAHATVATAVTAIRDGAFDYVEKPFDNDELKMLVQRALDVTRLARENRYLRAELKHRYALDALVAESPAMLDVLDLARRAARSRSTVLISGESGTGKEMIARTVHYHSDRVGQPFVAVNCKAFAEGVLESELFGHEKGAFTGAQYRKKGKFEIAEGGTVFLDEIGDISLKTQTDLLRVLQEREIVRVGGNQTIKVDFRCVAATNKNLEQLIEDGRFRPDLYYRLNVFHIELPALRERREDIPLLVNHFVQKFSREMNKRIVGISPSAMDVLQQQQWPGNIRELENAVERAMVVAQEPELREADFTLKPAKNGPLQPEMRTLEDVEKAHILRVLEECGGNQTKAAEMLGIDRVTLHHKLKKYGWNRRERELTAVESQ
jgi:DNA-binding NtrC family response regulator